MGAKSELHTPVMLREVVEGLAPRAGGIYIDATCGLGGHSEALLEASNPDGRVLGIDRDPEAIRHAKERLSRFADRFSIVEGSFSEIEHHARSTGHHPADGVLADLGISSMQIDEAERGFSIKREGPLDMRMGPSVGATAHELLASIDEPELAEILRDLGEVQRPRRVARAIVEAVRSGHLETTADLARVVERATPGRERRRSIHPATKVFQAIRIAVNRELEELDRFLEALPSVLRPGGRAAIISFHSLEDRRVKRAFRGPEPMPVPRGLPVEPKREEGPFRSVTRKPIAPSDDEVASNPRAKSAKLRVAELKGAVSA